MSTDLPTATASKFILKSKTILGAIVAVTPAILALFGKSLDVQDVTAFGTAVQSVLANLDSVVTAAGGVLVVYGRIKAQLNLHV